MNRPRFTIITPSFNQGPFLEECLLSVLDQDYDNLQYLVIDGGSTDESVDVIKRHAHRLDYWISERDRGQSHAINKGLEQADGDIIGWLTSDDILCPGTLKRVAELFDLHPEVDVVHGATELFWVGGGHTKGMEPGFGAAQYLSGMPSAQPSCFVRGAMMRRVSPLNESLHYGMDYEMVARIALLGKFLYVDEIFSRYRIHDTSKTNVQQALFAADWNVVYSDVVNSLSHAASIDTLKRLDLYHPTGRMFEVKHAFDDTCMHDATALAIYRYASFLELAGKSGAAAPLFRFLKAYHPGVYSFTGLSKIMWKIRLKALWK